ncbi:MAG TPA: MFS transporter, partial [Longimicrobium sp.]|nr:MFS transporter [Longimicrobium sp.]
MENRTREGTLKDLEALRGPGALPAPAPDDAPPAVATPEAIPVAPVSEAPPRDPWAALRHRNFRVFYLGQLLSLTGSWMQSTAQGWLVLDLTNSSLLLGIVTAAGSLPVLLFTLYAGVVADRMDKRMIILRAQAAATV